MASTGSISVPCPKCCTASRNQLPNPSTVPSYFARFPQGSNRFQSLPLKAKLQETAVESSTNSVPPSSKLDNKSSDDKDDKTVDESALSAFMAEVSDLIKLVDSRDIVELQLKQNDCELIIRKKEALPQQTSSAHVVTMQPPAHALLSPPISTPQAAPPAYSVPSPSSPAPAALPTPSKGSSSSLPPLKCPMAGTFYRCPAPGEPPFVKVGDKVQKGQVVCIIEAMKLMNEIEADHSGTVVEIIAEDGKPVSVDTPLLVIQP